MGIERHRRSPKGERAGASECSQREAVRHRRSKAEVADRELGSSSQSIEAQARARTPVSDTQKIIEPFPAGIEPTFKVEETLVLSVELREQRYSRF